MAKRFTVVDGSNAYYLLDNVTGLEACMSDGVGESSDPPGTEAFRVAWEDEVNGNVEEYFEAYFHRLDSLVIYDNDDTIDRYTVLVERASPLECHFQGEENLWICLGLSVNCDSPQGFSLWGFAVPNERLGEVIHFLDLPDNVQKHIVKRLEDERDERQPDTTVVPDGV